MWHTRRSAIAPGLPGLCASLAFLVVGCQNENPHQESLGKFSSTPGPSVQTPPPSPPSPPPPTASATTAAPPTNSPPSPVSQKSPPAVTPPSPPGPAVPLPASYYEWKDDEFYHHNEYKDRCVFPTSPTHKKGTMLDELFAWRDIIRLNYAFFEDVADIDPNDYVTSKNTFEEHFDVMTNSKSYIQKLRSLISDDNGKLKHGPYSARMTTDLTEELKNPYPEYTFGIEWEYISEDTPRDYKVRYTDPDSPAAQLAHGSPVVKRGDRLLKVNDFDFVNGSVSGNIKSVNELLVPENLIDTTKFVLQDLNTGAERTVNLRGVNNTKSDIHSRDSRTMAHTSVIETELGNVGYMHFGKYGGVPIRKNHREIENFKRRKVNDVILDFRYFDELDNNWWQTRYESSLAFMILGREKTLDEWAPEENSWINMHYHKDYRSVRRKVYFDKNVQLPNDFRDLDFTEWNRLISSSPFSAYRKIKLHYGDPTPFQYVGSDPGDRLEPIGFNSFCPRVLNRTLPELWFCTNYFIHNWFEWWPDFLSTFFWPLRFETLSLNKVYLIVSNHSCNRAELFINALRGIDVDIVLIGETTCGSPLRKKYFHNCGISVELIDGLFYNEKGFTNYEDGFRPENSKSKAGISIPGCYVKDDPSKSIGDVEEPMLKAALQYRKDKTCPPVP